MYATKGFLVVAFLCRSDCGYGLDLLGAGVDFCVIERLLAQLLSVMVWTIEPRRALCKQILQ